MPATGNQPYYRNKVKWQVEVKASIFEQETRRFYAKTIDWVLATGPRLVVAALLLFFGFWLIRILRRRVSKRMASRQLHSSLRPFFESLIFTALHVGLFFLVMQVLGIKLTVFAAVIAAFGAAAGLALSGTLQNFASGVLILLLKPFSVGDNVVAQGFEGTVTSIQIFYTIITTFDKRAVVMPNSKLSNEVIVNITQLGIRRLDIPLKLNHGADYTHITDVLRKLFIDIKEVKNDPAPRLGITAVDKDDFTLMCNVWVEAHGFEDSRIIIMGKVLGALRSIGVYMPAQQ